MTHKPALLCAVAAVLSPLGAHALGLGDITLNSALNEPLDAEIRLESATPNELRNLRAKIAGRETFGRYGLDYPDFLTGLTFSVAEGSAGPVLRVTSRRPIPEPFVTFLVEAHWDSGKLLREYTVLLDPPVFLPADQAPAPIAAPRTTVAPSAPSSGSISRPSAPAQTTRPSASSASQPVAPSGWEGGSEYGPVRRNETLYEIALRVRPDRSISPNQMMIALFNANPAAFGGNINVLRQGATLSVPSAASIRGISNSEALANVRRHNDSWRAGRPQAASTAAASASPAPAAAEAAGRLRLVSPDAGRADAEGGAGGGASEAALSAARERLADAEAQATMLRDKLESAQDELADARRLLELRDADLAKMQKNLADRADGQTGPVEPPASATDTAATPGVDLAGTDKTGELPSGETGITPDETVAPTPVPVATPAPVASVPEPESPGVFERIKSLGSFLWIGLLALLALGAAAFLVLRNRRSDSDDWEAELTAAAAASDLADDGTRIRPTTEVPVSKATGKTAQIDETGTFRPVDFASDDDVDLPVEAPSETAEYPFEDTMAGDSAMNLDQADPLAEADFHMAYGLYDQAAELVRKASEREPGRRDLRHKLLEIYFVWGNKSAFLDGARQLRESMGGNPDAEWDKIVIMGKQICPDDSLFTSDASGTVAASAIDLDLESGGQDTDFDLGGDTQLSDASAEMDLDLGEALAGSSAPVGGTEIQPKLAEDVRDDNILDFDLGLDDDTGTLAPTARDNIAAVRERIESGLLTSEETAEMDLQSLGVDLGDDDTGVQDFIETTETAAAGAPARTRDDDELDVDDLLGDFDSFTSLADDGQNGEETVQRLAPDFSGDGLDGDIDLDLGLGNPTTSLVEDDETEGELVTLDSIGADDFGDDEDVHFSAEIETLAGESIDMDFSDFGGSDDKSQPQPAAAGPDDETVLADLGEFSATGAESSSDFGDVFGADDETVMTDASANDYGSDDSATQILAPDESTQEMANVDLDVGDFVDDAEQAPTTMKVPAAELALPDADDDDALNEVGTKLDLARAYMDMGDPEGARGILEEVLEEGDDTQQQDARELLANLG